MGVSTLVVLDHLVVSNVPHLDRVVSAGCSDECSTGMKIHIAGRAYREKEINTFYIKKKIQVLAVKQKKKKDKIGQNSK